MNRQTTGHVLNTVCNMFTHYDSRSMLSVRFVLHKRTKIRQYNVTQKTHDTHYEKLYAYKLVHLRLKDNVYVLLCIVTSKRVTHCTLEKSIG